jgi:NAD(P)-dependent dehydrogenase (short-subunit alcohol dehydrogenase family)
MRSPDPSPHPTRPGMDLSLANRAVLVTGSGRGLGAHLVEAFLAVGARVVAQQRTPSRTLAAVAEQQPRLRLAEGDLTDQRHVADLFAEGFDGDEFHIVLNNAGTYPVTPILDGDPRDFARTVEANTLTTYNCLHHAAKHMQRSGSGGSIINIASLSASRTSGSQAAYDSAKAAVVRLTKSAAAELAAHGIRVNAVSPGLLGRPGLETDWPEGLDRWVRRCPMGRVGRYSDVANACLFLASDASSWITGHDLVVDGGMSVAPPY